MKKALAAVVVVLLLASALSAPALALKGKPDFAPHIYADGKAWGTKVTKVFEKGPNGHNDQSWDKLFVITNGAEGQLPVGEAAPGNPMYNGGRWWTHTATWIDPLPHPKPVLVSYDDVQFHAGLGHLTITEGTFDGGPPAFFLCPLLPVK